MNFIPTYLAREVLLCFAFTAGCATFKPVVPHCLRIMLLRIVVLAHAASEKRSVAEFAPHCAELFETKFQAFIPHICCINPGLCSVASSRKVFQLLMQPAVLTAQTIRADLGRLG